MYFKKEILKKTYIIIFLKETYIIIKEVMWLSTPNAPHPLRYWSPQQIPNFQNPTVISDYNLLLLNFKRFN